MIKMNKMEDFTLELLGQKLKAESMEYSKNVFRRRSQ